MRINTTPALMAEPIIFGLSFVALIPVFALVYCSLGADHFAGNLSSYIDFFYFSAVTATTLGYGDIFPSSETARMLVSLEVICGVVCAGLFLNACSYRLSARSAAEEKIRNEKFLNNQRYEANKAILLSHHSVVKFQLERYAVRLWLLTTPPEARKDFSLDVVFGLNGQVAKNFHFKDLRFLHQETLLARDAFRSSTVKYYFKDLGIFVEGLHDLLRFAQLDDWPKLRNDCLEFLHAYDHMNYSESILKFEEMGQNDAALRDMIFSQIASSPEVMPEIKGSHILDSYVCLFYLAKKSVEFCREYLETVDDVLNSDCPQL